MKKPIFTILLVLAASTLVLTGSDPGRPVLAAPPDPAVADALVVRFLVSGITDDGAKGSGTPTAATSITCTNAGSTTASLQVNVYQYDGTLLHTITMNPPALYTFTISTQPTALYYDDVILFSDAIYQGSTQILSDTPAIICTAQILDPLGYPPEYMDKLTLYDGNGNLMKDIRKVFLPLIKK